MDITKLIPHPENHRIYATQDLGDLEQSLEAHGQLEPVAVTKNYQIISGHRRVAAMRNLGWTDVDIRFIEPENDLIALVEHNRHRTKTSSDVLNEAKILSEQLKTLVGRGRNAATKRAGKRIKLIDEVAKRLDMGTSSLKQLQSVSNYEPDLIPKIDNKEISVGAAYQIVREKHLLPKRQKLASKIPEKTQQDFFKSDFSKLLDQHKPSIEQVNNVLKQTYPFSLGLTGVTEDQRVDLIEHLETRRRMNSEQFMLAQKMDDLEHDGFTNKQQTEAKKFLPTHDDLQDWWMKGVSAKVRKEGYDMFDDVRVIEVGTEDHFTSELWSIYRLHASSFGHGEGPGRGMRGFVILETSKGPKILGFFSFCSDSHTLGGRDEHLGWTTDQRAKNREHVVNLNTCIPTQPFGFNRLGGKFISLAALNLIKSWERKYNEKVVGVTTTALHGPTSQYNGMPKFWTNLKTTSGSMILPPDQSRYSFWRNWLKEHYPEDYENLVTRTSPKQAMLMSIYKILGINTKDYHHGYKRGVYFCDLYHNTREFLCDEVGIDDLEPKRIDWHDWYKLKARKRFESIERSKRTKTEQFWLSEINEIDFEVWLAAN